MKALFPHDPSRVKSNVSRKSPRLLHAAVAAVALGLASSGQSQPVVFTDGFESPTLNSFWTASASGGLLPAPSTARAHSGSQSLQLTSLANGQYKSIRVDHVFAQPLYGRASVWVYDTGADEVSANYISFYIARSGSSFNWSLLTMDYDLGPANGGNYYYQFDGVPPVATSIDRTKAWHQWTIEATAQAVTLAIDGTTVYTGPGGGPFDQVGLTMFGPSWRPAWTCYYDDFEVRELPPPAQTNVVLQLAGSCDTPGSAWDVFVAGGHAYVADEAGGVQVVDVRDRSQPVRVGSNDTPGLSYDVQVVGSYAFVADNQAGLLVLDVSNPAHPAQVGQVDTLWHDRAVQVVGRYAYTANTDEGLRVIDVSDPIHPRLAAQLVTPGWGEDVKVVGNYAYLLDWRWSIDPSVGLHVIDISDPLHPVQRGVVPVAAGLSRSLDVAGRYAYVAAEANGLVVFDVSNSAQPVRVGGYDTTGEVYAVQIVGHLAYVADGQNGLQVFDVSNPAQPVPVGGYGSTTAIGVQVDGAYVYVAAGTSGLVILRLMNVPPTITAQPQTQSVRPGSNATFAVQTVGSESMQYQWQFNGTNIPGATGASLTVSNAGLAQAGVYTVVVSNPYGTNVSAPAVLTLLDLKMYAGLTIAGPTTLPYTVQYRDAFTPTNTWRTITTNLMLPSSPYLFIDLDSPGRPQRFYQAFPTP